MPILKLNLNFALTIRLKFHHFSVKKKSNINCLLRCAPTLFKTLLAFSVRNRIFGVQGSKQKSDSVNTLQFLFLCQHLAILFLCQHLAILFLCQHLAISPRTDNPVTVPQHSALRDHCH